MVPLSRYPHSSARTGSSYENRPGLKGPYAAAVPLAPGQNGTHLTGYRQPIRLTQTNILSELSSVNNSFLLVK